MMGRGVASPFERPVAVTLYFAFHAAAALLVSLPATALVGGTGIGRFPEGDRLLFAPGGLVASEVVRLVAPALPAHLSSSLGMVAVLGALLVVPYAALLVALTRRERGSQASLWGRALRHVPALIALSGMGLAAQTFVVTAALTLAGALRDSMDGVTGRSADLAWLAAVSAGLALSLGVGIVRDLGRAAAVRHALDAKSALLAGLHAFARAPGRSFGRWLLPAVVGIALVAVGAALTALLDVSRPGMWRLALVATIHQTVALSLCFCRAYWLSATLVLVGQQPSVHELAETP
jgi:hypothetical protein